MTDLQKRDCQQRIANGSCGESNHAGAYIRPADCHSETLQAEIASLQRQCDAERKARLEHSATIRECHREFVERDKRQAKVEAENASLNESVAALEAKVKSLAPHGTCACSYDAPQHVCNHHSPQLTALQAQLAAKEREIAKD